MKTCPVCAGSGEVPWRLDTVVTGYNRRRLVQAILESPEGLTSNELLIKLYGQNSERWPRSDIRVISVLIWHANGQLLPHGYAIKCAWRGGRGGHSPYVLVKLDADTEYKSAVNLHTRSMERPEPTRTASNNR